MTMLAIEPPRPGTVIHWAISDILTRNSCDLDQGYDTLWEYHEHDEDCGAVWTETTGVNPYTGRTFGFWDDCTYEPNRADAWYELMECKRNDDNYDDVYESIKTKGFVRPVTARYSEETGLEFGDGHHRLTAAYDLGMETVPVFIGTDYVISGDSGSWYAEYEIPTEITNRR